uniref:PSP proline-rich domain-containing protein n=1 Tax=Clytia hemisphaerica TaxID=252671 RepID=A0A7M5VEW8_9CNID
MAQTRRRKTRSSARNAARGQESTEQENSASQSEESQESQGSQESQEFQLSQEQEPEQAEPEQVEPEQAEPEQAETESQSEQNVEKSVIENNEGEEKQEDEKENEQEDTYIETNIVEPEAEPLKETETENENENIVNTQKESETFNENDVEPTEVRSPEMALSEPTSVEGPVDSPQQESMEQETLSDKSEETETHQQEMEEADSPPQDTMQPETPPRITEEDPPRITEEDPETEATSITESAPVEDTNVMEMDQESSSQEETNIEFNIPAPEIQITPEVQTTPEVQETVTEVQDTVTEVQETVTKVQPSTEESSQGEENFQNEESFHQEETTKIDTFKEITPEEKEPSQKGKKKKKRRRKRAKAEQRTVQITRDDDDDFEVEYVSEKIDLPQWDPNYAAFQSIFETFKLEEKAVIKTEDTEKKVETKKPIINPSAVDDDDDDDDDEDPEKEKKEEPEKMSKKQLKKQSRMEVATLKQMVTRPDVVEMHDVNSKDPQILVYLKAYKNTVPVPRHWCFKRKYLAGKRGFLKNPFELPEFIKQTGIMEMRAAMQEKEDAKTLKSKQRGKIRPKLGKIDIDYQKLHDAFFKFQTKPKMTIHGDLYYEGKEFEVKLKEKKPGDLTDDLRTALGMPVGPGKELIPPPWLIAMQRYGPPPSYPNLKIAGLNAPIPEGSSFGYHAGGWGKPPVDEMGKPLYGDVFGTMNEDPNAGAETEDTIDRTPWGELESESESEMESEEEDDDEDQTGLITPGDAGLVTPSGMSSVGAGLETPDMIELRKRKEIEDAMETGGDTPALYTVLNEKKTNVGASMMGSQHTYDLAPSKKAGDGVEITLDPSELELEPSAMAAKYDDTMKEREANVNREDFSDMVAEHNAKKKRKKPTDSGKAAKKYKEFKF